MPYRTRRRPQNPVNLYPPTSEWLDAHGYPPLMTRAVKRGEVSYLAGAGAEWLQYWRGYTSKLWWFNGFVAFGWFEVYATKPSGLVAWVAILASTALAVAYDAMCIVMVVGAVWWYIERMLYNEQ